MIVSGLFCKTFGEWICSPQENPKSPQELEQSLKKLNTSCSVATCACSPLSKLSVSWEKPGLAADIGLHREADHKEMVRREGWNGRTLMKTSIPLCALVSCTSCSKWVLDHHSGFQISFRKGAKGSGTAELAKDVSTWKDLNLWGHLPYNLAVDTISFSVSAEGCSYHAEWICKSMGVTAILKTP